MKNITAYAIAEYVWHCLGLYPEETHLGGMDRDQFEEAVTRILERTK